MKYNKTVHVIARYFYPVIAGLEINMLETYSFFTKKGWKVIVHTTNNSHLEENVLADNEIINGIIIKRYTTKKYLFSLLKNRKLFQNKDLVVLHDFDISNHLFIYIKFFILDLLRKKRNLVIFSSHGLFNYTTDIYPGLRMETRKFIQNTLGVFLINHVVNGIRCVSGLEANGLIKSGIKNSLIRVITNGIQKEAFLKNPSVSKEITAIVKQNQPYILQVGRIDRVKNYEVVIKALKLLPEKINLLIAGPVQDIIYKKELDDLVASLNLEKRVKFLGSIIGNGKYYLYRHALVFVHMALSEAFGNSINEALSQGAICIVSESTAQNGLVKNNINGFAVDTNNEIELKNKINDIINIKSKNSLSDMRNKNREVAKLHTWESVAKKVEDFYLNVMSKYETI